MKSKAYIVFLKGKTRELVGILIADDIERLKDLIDEATDPANCEICELLDGGVLWNMPGTPVISEKGTDLTGALFTQSLEVDLMDGNPTAYNSWRAA